MNRRNSTLITIVAIIGLIVIFGIGQYNGLAKQEQTVESAWGQVENVLQRRQDLIPNLVNTVKGSMNHETEVFKSIADARKAYNNASTDKEKIKASQQVDQSVGTLISVINENYPQLTSNKNVQTLMTQLEGTENRIAVERKRYNEAVQDYNQKVVSFPKNIFANMMGLGKKPYFKADESAHTVPSVNFDSSSSNSKGSE